MGHISTIAVPLDAEWEAFMQRVMAHDDTECPDYPDAMFGALVDFRDRNREDDA